MFILVGFHMVDTCSYSQNCAHTNYIIKYLGGSFLAVRHVNSSLCLSTRDDEFNARAENGS